MSNSRKMNPDEMSRMKSAQDRLRRSRNLIADAEIALYNLNIRKKVALDEADDSTKELEALAGEIKAKYGDVHIDFATGELTKRK